MKFDWFRVVGSLGVSPTTSAIQVTLEMGGVVFGRPFLLYHRSGDRFPQPLFGLWPSFPRFGAP